MADVDSFWDQLVDHGLLSMDQVGRARTRHAQYGGGLDTAVLEVTALDATELQRLLQAVSEAVGLPPASSEFLDAPDLEALARLPRPLIERYGVITSRELDGRPVLVAPALPPHELNEIRLECSAAARLYVALEVDIWEALERFVGITSPERLQALWRGECPSVLTSGQYEACGPVAIPRSTALCIDGVIANDNEQDFVRRYGDGSSPVTRPGRPQALGLADTADFETRDPRLLAPQSGSTGIGHTSDDLTAISSATNDDFDHSCDDSMSIDGPLNSNDTIPPAG